MNDELLYELILQDPEDEVFAVSFVDKPAIERDFVFFSKQHPVFYHYIRVSILNKRDLIQAL